MNIGIIGNGFVGNATKQLYSKDINVIIYDIKSELCFPKGIKLNDLLICDCIFICVPTPINKNGSYYLNIVENVIKDLNNIFYKGFIILRSTVSVGTSNNLKCYFMPEFLTEKNYINDFINNNDWIFGLLNNNNNHKFVEYIKKLFNKAYENKVIKNNNLHFVNNNEAEMIKLFRNSILANKISFCNEIYQYCNKLNINYNIVQNYACKDNRIQISHTYVPGPDGLFGYGGTCFPKDVNSLKYEMEKIGLNPCILSAMKYRNENIDRTEKEWENDIGRSVIEK